MARRTYDPLGCIPSPDVIREKLTETETLAARLRVLLDVSERIHAPHGAPAESRGVVRAEASSAAR